MIHLVLAVVAGVLAVIVYKEATRCSCRRLPLIAVERTVSVAVLCLYGLSGKGYEVSWGVVLLGLGAGVALFSARWLLLKALTFGKAGVSWTIVNLSVVLPVLFAMIVWKEEATVYQVIGLVLVPLGIILMREKSAGTPAEAVAWDNQAQEERRKRRSWLKFILLCLFLEGAFALSFKLVGRLRLAESRNMFILLYNFFALTLALPLVVRARAVPGRKELVAGAAAGVCVSVSAIFFITAAAHLEAIRFYPIATASSIVLVAIASRLIWKERTTAIQKVGMVLALAAIGLIAMG